MTDPRVVIVGAGPAGTRAAETLARAGLRPIVIDEAPRSGGQAYRRPPTGFAGSARALYGVAADKARRLHRAFDALAGAVEYRPDTLVWDIAEATVHTSHGAAIDAVPFDALVLATGAMDRIIPLPGWTTPGIFTLGGAQVALKHQGCAVGRRTAFLGTGPLLYLVAYEYAKAGAEVAAVLDTARPLAAWRALPALAAGGATLLQGLFYLGWLRARGVPMATSVRPLRVIGEAAVSALIYRGADGAERRIDCDAVGLGYGLKPETQLADLAGCRFRFDAAARQWLPETDGAGRAAGLRRVYLAGDGASIAGADAAELTGERVAWALLADLGRPAPAARVAAIDRRLRRLGRFRAGIEAAFPFPVQLAGDLDDDTILCRCERVVVGELRAAAASATEINRAKAICRVGMGRCQGRVCGPAAAELLAAARGVEVERVGRLRGQPPVKPLPVGVLAAGAAP